MCCSFLHVPGAVWPRLRQATPTCHDSTWTFVPWHFGTLCVLELMVSPTTFRIAGTSGVPDERIDHHKDKDAKMWELSHQAPHEIPLCSLFWTAGFLWPGYRPHHVEDGIHLSDH